MNAERRMQNEELRKSASHCFPNSKFCILRSAFTVLVLLAAAQPIAGTVVLASDNMYLYENLEKRAPIAQTFDRQSNLRAQDRMKTIAGKPELIIPGHDPAVMTRFPKVAEGVARID